MTTVLKLRHAAAFFKKHIDAFDNICLGEDIETMPIGAVRLSLVDAQACALAADAQASYPVSSVNKPWYQSWRLIELHGLLFGLADMFAAGQSLDEQRRHHLEVLLEVLTGKRQRLPARMSHSHFLQIYGRCPVVYRHKRQMFRHSLNSSAQMPGFLARLEMEARDLEGATIH